MAWKLGEAFIKLTADPRQLVADMRKAEGHVDASAQAMSMSWSSAFKLGLVGLAAQAVGQLTNSLRNAAIATIEQGDRLRELSQITGVAVEDLSRLDYAGQTAGVGLEEIGNAMRFLAKNQDMAIKGSKSAIDMFDRIGVSVGELKGMRPDEVFKRIADAMKNGTVRGNEVTVAMGLMGRAGAGMVPLLMEGADGITELGNRADATGYTLSTEFANNADAFGDSITMLKNDAAGFARTLTQDLLEAVIGFNDYVSKDLPEGFTLGGMAAKGLGFIIKALATSWTTVFHIVRSTTMSASEALIAYAASAKQALSGDVSGALETYNKHAAASAKAQAERNKEYQASLGKIAGLEGAFSDARKKSAEELAQISDEERKKTEAATAAQELQNLQLRAKNELLKGNKKAAEALQQEYDNRIAAKQIEEGVSMAVVGTTVALQREQRQLERNAERRKQDEAESKKAEAEHKKNRERVATALEATSKANAAAEKEAREQARETARVRAQAIIDMLQLNRDVSAELQAITSSEFENEKSSILARSEERRAEIEQSVMSEQWKADAIVRINELQNEELRNLNASYGLDFERMLEQQIAAFGTVAQRMAGMWKQTTDDMTTLFGDVFYSAFVGDMEGIEDAFDSFLKKLLRRIMNFLAEQAVIKLLQMLATSGKGTWWGALAGAAEKAMAAKGGGGGCETLHLANGGVVQGGFRAFAGGGVATSPTLGLIGEAGMNEAVVPLPDGKSIPVEMAGGGGDVVINQRIVITPDLLTAGRPSDAEIVNAVTSDIARHGGMYQQIRRRR